MEGFYLDWTVFWVVIAATALAMLLAMRRRWWQRPLIHFSDVSAFPLKISRGRQFLLKAPRRLMWTSVLLLGAALTDPHHRIKIPDSNIPQLEEDNGDKREEEVSVPTEGIAIYLVLDRSGSMAEQVVTLNESGRKVRMSKINLLKQVTARFIQGDSRLGFEGRRDDMIGLVAFARVPQVLSPLTLDHQAVLAELSNFNSVKDSSQDGTAIGYAIYKTVNLIVATKYFGEQLVKAGKPAYQIKSTVMVLVTDGLQGPHPEDRGHPLRSTTVETAAAYATENGVRLYIVNVEPALLSARFNYERGQLQNAAEQTGGKLFVADDSHSLADIYREIDSLERSRLPEEIALKAYVEEKSKADGEGLTWKRLSYVPLLVSLALIFLAMAVVLETCVVRRVP